MYLLLHHFFKLASSQSILTDLLSYGFLGAGQATEIPVGASFWREFINWQNWKNIENGAPDHCGGPRKISSENGWFDIV